MNRYGVAAFHFATVPGSDQMVVGPTHLRGGSRELLLTDVPDLVRAAVVAPIGATTDHSSLRSLHLNLRGMNSDHSSMWAVI